jgi:DeoR family transcriptional regulator, glycerol-3-phosphate regulon repressor
MLESRHQSEILQAVRMRGSCTIGELAAHLDVSGETVRRHIRPLVDRGLVRRVHGGIMLPDHLEEPPFQRRMLENREAKQRIAAAVASRIHNGDSLMLDTGSTTAYIAMALSSHANLSVITNSVEIARTLATRNGNRVYMAGGELRSDDGAAFGPGVQAFVRQFDVRYAILSIGAIHAEQGFMNFHLCEGEFARAIVAQAERTIIAADHSKFGRRALVKVCDPNQVRAVVTEAEPPAPFGERLRQAEVELVIAGS